MNEAEYLNTIFQKIDASIVLDDDQKRAITEDSPYLLLVAGAGSGKTTTMAAKVKYLVDRKNINPQEILVISFTNQATKELQMRINNDFHIPCQICTFHKLGYDILKRVGFKDYRVLEDSNQIINQYFEQIGCKKKEIITFFEKYFQEKNNVPKWSKFCYDFLKAWKTKGYTFEQFQIEKAKYVDERYTFLSIMEEIYHYYETIRQAHHLIDFDDMIVLATHKVSQITLPYRYIMVDEYQDISPIRFQLIQKIIIQNKAKLIAVGDDFQSIFAFAGSDITLFSDFKKGLGGTILPITHTYRNSQQLIDVAGNFVMQNPKQYKKKLTSSKKVKLPIVIHVYDDRKNNTLQIALKKCLTKIFLENTHANVALLGRYRFEERILSQDEDFYKQNNQWIYKPYPTLKLTFLTVHAAKGLGFDEVILLNGKEDIFGFPSKIKDDLLMQIAKEEEKTILLAEERRLFYVALTRTKHKIYLLTPAYHPSIFIREISSLPMIEMDDPKHLLSYKKQKICPNCGSKLMRHYHPFIYPYYICCNQRVCHFKTNNLFYRYPITSCPICQTGKVLVYKKDEEYIIKCNHCHYVKT